MHLDYEAALHHVSEVQLKAVAERGMDKKVCSSYIMIKTSNVSISLQASVRTQALNSLGRLYNLAYPEM